MTLQTFEELEMLAKVREIHAKLCVPAPAAPPAQSIDEPVVETPVTETVVKTRKI